MIHLTWIIPAVVAFTMASIAQTVDGTIAESFLAWARGILLFAIGVALGIICECISRGMKKSTR